MHARGDTADTIGPSVLEPVAQALVAGLELILSSERQN